MAAKFSQDHSVTLVLSQFMIHFYCSAMFLFFDATRLLFLLHCSFLYTVSKIPTHTHTQRDTHLISVRDFLYASQYRWRQHSRLYFYTSHAWTYTILQLIGKYKTFTKAGI